MPAYAYIAECSDGSYYAGWTYDLQSRIDAHNAGKGARYTRSRGPVKLVYYEEYPGKAEAQSREYAIKKLSRAQKQELVVQFALLQGPLS